MKNHWVISWAPCFTATFDYNTICHVPHKLFVVRLWAWLQINLYPPTSLRVCSYAQGLSHAPTAKWWSKIDKKKLRSKILLQIFAFGLPQSLLKLSFRTNPKEAAAHCHNKMGKLTLNFSYQLFSFFSWVEPGKRQCQTSIFHFQLTDFITWIKILTLSSSCCSHSSISRTLCSS